MTRQILYEICAARLADENYKNSKPSWQKDIASWFCCVLLGLTPFFAVLAIYTFVDGMIYDLVMALALSLFTIIGPLCAAIIFDVAASPISSSQRKIIAGLALAILVATIVIFLIATLYTYSPLKDNAGSTMLFIEITRTPLRILIYAIVLAILMLILGAIARYVSYSKRHSIK